MVAADQQPSGEGRARAVKLGHHCTCVAWGAVLLRAVGARAVGAVACEFVTWLAGWLAGRP